MNKARQATISAAVFALICFFLPWMQLSCLGLRDSVSGLDLARGGDRLLWLVPCFMLAILLLGLARPVWERMPAVFALTSTVGGAISAYLMYRERLRPDRGAVLIAGQMTVWFWFGFIAS
ncbi:MAG TPA: hypothetical protein VNO70_04635, partial [Blastocatellia bacterium]|nr:hypothetical protein [Blastocatellia bacterium]